MKSGPQHYRLSTILWRAGVGVRTLRGASARKGRLSTIAGTISFKRLAAGRVLRADLLGGAGWRTRRCLLQWPLDAACTQGQAQQGN